MVYLDWASTTPPESAFLAAGMSAALEYPANPSSAHSAGKAARAALEEARARLLACLRESGPMAASGSEASSAPGAARRGSPEATTYPRLVFTGSGSEADAIPLLALMSRRRGPEAPHLVLSAIEHPAIHEQARLLERLGLGLSLVDPGPDGLLDPAKVAEALRPNTQLVAVMAVNNETGAIQPIDGIAEALRRASPARQPRLHVDAVQAFGKLPFDPSRLGCASAAVSAHKLRGPRGVGALWLGSAIEPLVVGGGQEGGARPGTEDLAGAVAFAAAAEAALRMRETNRAQALDLELRLIEGLEGMGALPLPLGRKAGDQRYLPSILSASFPGLSGEVLVRALSDEGFALSTGSACSNNSQKKGRRILEAMGLPRELSFSAIRISTGPATTAAEVDAFLDTAARLHRRLRT